MGCREGFENWEDAYDYWIKNCTRYYSDKDEAERHGFEEGWDAGRRTLEPVVRDAIDELKTISLSILHTSLTYSQLIKAVADKLQSALKEVEVAVKREDTQYTLSKEGDEDTWECKHCGMLWTLIDGTPEDNRMNYCPGCGRKIKYALKDQTK